nr:MAG TPA: hypothetical protein [Caudoviricetes sp.]
MLKKQTKKKKISTNVISNWCFFSIYFIIDRIFYLSNIQQAYNNFSCFAAAFATVSLFNTLTLFFKLYPF